MQNYNPLAPFFKGDFLPLSPSGGGKRGRKRGMLGVVCARNPSR